MAAATLSVGTNATGAKVLILTPGDNEEQNTLFQRIVSSFNSAPPGSYKTRLESAVSGIDSTALQTLLPQSELNKVTDFYVQKNVTTQWDPATQGAVPPVGQFDSTYYAQQNPELIQKWNSAQTGVTVGNLKIPDVDITNRYTQDTFLHQHYTTTGKTSGLRGNSAQETTNANTYSENRRGLTDLERQRLRDSFLGIKGSDAPAPVDASVEELVNQENQKKFNYLVQDVLKNTVNELNKARAKESSFNFLRTLPGFDEVYNVKSTLMDSLLGDTGIGGYLSMTGQADASKNIEKGIESLLGGTNNSVTYNWQKWFDEQLAERYSSIEEISNPQDAKEVLKIDQAFAKNFVDNYLKPRFDNSKSMSEFLSYMNVAENEQNILQTQTVSNKLKELAVNRVQSFIGELGSSTKGFFDPDFYFNPDTSTAVGDKRKLYNSQTAKVSADWEAAKSNPQGQINGLSWEQWAYRYGLDINKKEDFARLHYEVIGKNAGFDPSSDKPSQADLNNFIQSDLTPYLAEAKQSFGDSVFLSFMTPDQLANQLVGSLDPLRTPEEWNKVLADYGIDGTNKTVDEVKGLILEATRTVPAADIRERILDLNKKNLTPTQERLGIEYIQREEDDARKPSTGETALYQLFKSAGYGGSENDFYNEFMTDTTREEQNLITQGLKGKGLDFSFDFSDPFAALGSLESFDTMFEPKSSTTIKSSTDSYFRLFNDQDETEEQLSRDPSLAGMFSSFGSGASFLDF